MPLAILFSKRLRPAPNLLFSGGRMKRKATGPKASTKSPAAKTQIAVLPWRLSGAGAEQVLLITSRETRRWVIPKGWRMRDLADNMAAAQEAFEEAGVEGYTGMSPIGAYSYDKRLNDGTLQPIHVIVYPLQVSVELDAWPEQLQRERMWVSPRVAADLVDEPELSKLLADFAPYGFRQGIAAKPD